MDAWSAPAMMALLSPRAWVAIAFAAMLALLGAQQLRVSHYKQAVAEAQTTLANDRTAYAQAAQKAEQAARARETQLQGESDAIAADARQQAEEAILAVSLADAAASSLRGQLARYVAAVRKASADSGIASGGKTAADPSRLLADLLAELDRRAGVYAKVADESRRAGNACVRSYETLTAD